jgi:hypothetical protein
MASATVMMTLLKFSRKADEKAWSAGVSIAGFYDGFQAPWNDEVDQDSDTPRYDPHFYPDRYGS